MFFVSDEADRYFVSSPWSEALRLLLGKIFWNRVLDAQNFDRTKCGEDSQIQKYFELGNVGRIYKSLGCLEKTPRIFCEKKKKKKKKEEECS